MFFYALSLAKIHNDGIEFLIAKTKELKCFYFPHLGKLENWKKENKKKINQSIHPETQLNMQKCFCICFSYELCKMVKKHKKKQHKTA